MAEERNFLLDALGRGVDQSQASFYAFIDAVGELTGINILEKFGEDGVRRNIESMMRNPARVESWDDADGLKKKAQFVIERMLEEAPSFAMQLATVLAPAGGSAAALVGTAAGRAKLAAAAASSQTGKSMARIIGREALRGFDEKAAITRAAVYDIAEGSGETQLGLMEAGVEAPAKALLGGVAKGLLDLVGEKLIVDTVLKTGMPADKVLNIAINTARRVTGATAAEGLTEAAQTALDRMIVSSETGEPVFDEEGLKAIKEAAIAGAAVGGGFGAIGGGVRMAQDIRELSDRRRGETEDVLSRFRETEPPEPEDTVAQLEQSRQQSFDFGPESEPPAGPPRPPPGADDFELTPDFGPAPEQQSFDFGPSPDYGPAPEQGAFDFESALTTVAQHTTPTHLGDGAGGEGDDREPLEESRPLTDPVYTADTFSQRTEPQPSIAGLTPLSTIEDLSPVPEPQSDIDAQFMAMLSPSSAKDTVLVMHNGPQVSRDLLTATVEGTLPDPQGDLFSGAQPAPYRSLLVDTDQGLATVYTTNPRKYKQLYRATTAKGSRLNERQLGALLYDRLGSKLDTDGTSVVATDAADNVVAQINTSPAALEQDVATAVAQAPEGGSVRIDTIENELQRRAALRADEDERDIMRQQFTPIVERLLQAQDTRERNLATLSPQQPQQMDFFGEAPVAPAATPDLAQARQEANAIVDGLTQLPPEARQKLPAFFAGAERALQTGDRNAVSQIAQSLRGAARAAVPRRPELEATPQPFAAEAAPEPAGPQRLRDRIEERFGGTLQNLLSSYDQQATNRMAEQRSGLVNRLAELANEFAAAQQAGDIPRKAAAGKGVRAIQGELRRLDAQMADPALQEGAVASEAGAIMDSLALLPRKELEDLPGFFSTVEQGLQDGSIDTESYVEALMAPVRRTREAREASAAVRQEPLTLDTIRQPPPVAGSFGANMAEAMAAEQTTAEDEAALAEQAMEEGDRADLQSIANFGELTPSDFVVETSAPPELNRAIGKKSAGYADADRETRLVGRGYDSEEDAQKALEKLEPNYKRDVHGSDYEGFERQQPDRLLRVVPYRFKSGREAYLIQQTRLRGAVASEEAAQVGAQTEAAVRTRRKRSVDSTTAGARSLSAVIQELIDQATHSDVSFHLYDTTYQLESAMGSALLGKAPARDDDAAAAYRQYVSDRGGVITEAPPMKRLATDTDETYEQRRDVYRREVERLNEELTRLRNATFSVRHATTNAPVSFTVASFNAEKKKDQPHYRHPVTGEKVLLIPKTRRWEFSKTFSSLNPNKVVSVMPPKTVFDASIVRQLGATELNATGVQEKISNAEFAARAFERGLAILAERGWILDDPEGPYRVRVVNGQWRQFVAPNLFISKNQTYGDVAGNIGHVANRQSQEEIKAWREYAEKLAAWYKARHEKKKAAAGRHAELAGARPVIALPMRYRAAAGELRPELASRFPNGAPLTELIRQGLRTATTRAVPRGVRPGAVITIDGVDGKFVVTEIDTVDLTTPEGREKWSKREGWDAKTAAAKYPRQVFTGAKQIVFERIEAPAADTGPKREVMGGTGQAVRIANAYDIPTHNLYTDPNAVAKMVDALPTVTKPVYYAGIGSRDTPADVMPVMTELAKKLAKKGYILRSGGAKGADSAFEAGAGGKAQIFLPWMPYDGRTDGTRFDAAKARTIAVRHYPTENNRSFDKLKRGAQKLHTRNTAQVLGPDPGVSEPSAFVILWAEPSARGMPTEAPVSDKPLPPKSSASIGRAAVASAQQAITNAENKLFAINSVLYPLRMMRDADKFALRALRAERVKAVEELNAAYAARAAVAPSERALKWRSDDWYETEVPVVHATEDRRDASGAEARMAELRHVLLTRGVTTDGIVLLGGTKDSPEGKAYREAEKVLDKHSQREQKPEEMRVAARRDKELAKLAGLNGKLQALEEQTRAAARALSAKIQNKQQQVETLRAERRVHEIRKEYVGQPAQTITVLDPKAPPFKAPPEPVQASTPHQQLLASLAALRDKPGKPMPQETRQRRRREIETALRAATDKALIRDAEALLARLTPAMANKPEALAAFRADVGAFVTKYSSIDAEARTKAEAEFKKAKAAYDAEYGKNAARLSKAEQAHREQYGIPVQVGKGTRYNSAAVKSIDKRIDKLMEEQRNLRREVDRLRTTPQQHSDYEARFKALRTQIAKQTGVVNALVYTDKELEAASKAREVVAARQRAIDEMLVSKDEDPSLQRGLEASLAELQRRIAEGDKSPQVRATRDLLLEYQRRAKRRDYLLSPPQHDGALSDFDANGFITRADMMDFDAQDALENVQMEQQNEGRKTDSFGNPIKTPDGKTGLGPRQLGKTPVVARSSKTTYVNGFANADVWHASVGLVPDAIPSFIASVSSKLGLGDTPFHVVSETGVKDVIKDVGKLSKQQRAVLDAFGQNPAIKAVIVETDQGAVVAIRETPLRGDKEGFWAFTTRIARHDALVNTAVSAHLMRLSVRKMVADPKQRSQYVALRKAYDKAVEAAPDNKRWHGETGVFNFIMDALYRHAVNMAMGHTDASVLGKETSKVLSHLKSSLPAEMRTAEQFSVVLDVLEAAADVNGRSAPQPTVLSYVGDEGHDTLHPARRSDGRRPTPSHEHHAIISQRVKLLARRTVAKRVALVGYVRTVADAQRVLNRRLGTAMTLPSTTKAVYMPPSGHDGRARILLVSENIADPYDGLRTLRHEIVGHHGLAAFMTLEERDKLLEMVRQSDNLLGLGKHFNEIKRLYPDLSDVDQLEEIIAKIAEDMPDSSDERQYAPTKALNAVKAAWRAIKDFLHRVMRRLGLVSADSLSENEVREVLKIVLQRINRSYTVHRPPRTPGDLSQRITLPIYGSSAFYLARQHAPQRARDFYRQVQGPFQTPRKEYKAWEEWAWNEGEKLRAQYGNYRTRDPAYDRALTELNRAERYMNQVYRLKEDAANRADIVDAALVRPTLEQRKQAARMASLNTARRVNRVLFFSDTVGRPPDWGEFMAQHGDAGTTWLMTRNFALKGPAFVRSWRERFPILEDLAILPSLGELLYKTPQAETKPDDEVSYNVAVNRKRAEMHARVFALTKDWSDETTKRVFNEVASEHPYRSKSAEAKALTDIMTDFGEYLREAMPLFTPRENYFPRSWETIEINNRKEEFIALLRKHGVTDNKQAVDVLNALSRFGLSQSYELDAEMTDLPAFGKARTFKNPAFIREAVEKKFLNADPITSMFAYFQDAIRRAEAERLFGRLSLAEMRFHYYIPYDPYEKSARRADATIPSSYRSAIEKEKRSGLTSDEMDRLAFSRRWMSMTLAEQREVYREEARLQREYYDSLTPRERAQLGWVPKAYEELIIDSYRPYGRLGSLTAQADIVDTPRLRMVKKMFLGTVMKTPYDPNDPVVKVLTEVRAYESFRTLLFSGVASIPEIAGVFLRAKDISLYDFSKMMADLVFNRGNARDNLMDLAELMGALRRDTGAAMATELSSREGYGVVSKHLPKMFKYNMNDAVTNLSRVAAISAGRSFLQTQSTRVMEAVAQHGDIFDDDGNVVRVSGMTPEEYVRVANAVRRLSALGLHHPGEVFMWVTDGMPSWQPDVRGDARNDRAKVMQDAVIQFMNEAVLNPVSSERPEYADTVFGAMVFHLQQFAHSFVHVIVEGNMLDFTTAIRETKKQGGEIAAARALMPFMFGAMFVFVALGALSEELRRRIASLGTQGGWDRANGDPSTYLKTVMFERTGLDQIPFFDVVAGDGRPDSMAYKLGPTAYHASELSSALFREDPQLLKALLNSTPVVSQLPALRYLVYQGTENVEASAIDEV